MQCISLKITFNEITLYLYHGSDDKEADALILLLIALYY